MLALLAVLQAPLAPIRPDSGDTIPVVSLDEALNRAAHLDPNYVAATGAVGTAEWVRWSALAVFVVPAVTLGTTATRYSEPFFNFGTADLRINATQAQFSAQYDFFTGGQKLQAARAAGAQLESAKAGEVEQRFLTAMQTEDDFYSVLVRRALARVAEDQVHRAEQQLAVARARVQTGAAVQTDSLQLFLTLNQSQVALLQQRTALRVAQLELGRRIGLDGPADAELLPQDSAPAPQLPFSVQDAVTRALSQGPSWRVARANERAASAQLWGARGTFLPRASIAFNAYAFDDKFFPEFKKVSALTLTVTWPILDNGLREIQVSQASATHEVAQAVREDLERAAWRDVTQAYDAYETSRATAALQRTAVDVAQENNRVQETRYRAGATTILDLLDAQNRLVQAQADLVQSLYTTKLARAGLEVMLGERITFDQDHQ